MPRSIWNGTITFGLIAVPIKVHSATEDKGVHFHQVHAKDGAQIKQKRVCSKDGKEVPYTEVAKGYEVKSGEYVLLSKHEVAAAAGEHSRLIELEEFVCAPEIDPVFYDKTYYLGAGEKGEDSYRLLHDALAKSKRAGIGRWVFHNREYLVAIRSQPDEPGAARKSGAGRRAGGTLRGVLALHTMRFADELVDAGDLDVPSPSRKPTSREVNMAGKLVDSLHDKFKPDDFSDSYRERVLELIAMKARGEEPTPPEVEPDDNQTDLMAALEASLAGSR
jgi:DNA end-binding protein Ku